MIENVFGILNTSSLPSTKLSVVVVIIIIIIIVVVLAIINFHCQISIMLTVKEMSARKKKNKKDNGKIERILM